MGRWSCSLLVWAAASAAYGSATTNPTDAAGPTGWTRPRLLLIDADSLAWVKQRLAAGDSELMPALVELRRLADQAMAMKPVSVMDKPTVPPSGDKHDYMSLGTYWWPNPKTPDGLPYVRRDGEHNPEGNKLDSPPMRRMCHSVATLALAWQLTDHPPYAEHAARLLRVWFLDPATRMNPHLKYGQAIPGVCTGRALGIIDTHVYGQLVDAALMLESSSAWSKADRDGFREWCRRYLDFLIDSKEGREEAVQPNNHGTWYDVQVAALAMFVDRPDIARQTLSKSAARRIDAQIEPDGRQPLELARTNSYGYSCMNLLAMFNLATLGRHVGVDLADYRSADGRSIRTALDWLVEHATAEGKWKYRLTRPIEPQAMVPLLRRASIAFREPRYEQLAARLADTRSASAEINLTYSRPAWAAAPASDTRPR